MVWRGSTTRKGFIPRIRAAYGSDRYRPHPKSAGVTPWVCVGAKHKEHADGVGVCRFEARAI